jgi:outer membrane protein TolC
MLWLIVTPFMTSQAVGQTSPSAPLTLSDAITKALAESPNARVAAQQLAQAEARVGQAQAGRRFQITFNSTASGSNADVIQPPPAHETFGTFQNTLTIPLPVGPKANLAIRQSEAQLDSAQAQYESARLSLANQVTTAYYDLLRKQTVLQVAQETLALDQHQADDTAKRNRAGDVPELDVLRSQSSIASAQSQQIGAQNDVAVAQQALNSLIGQSLNAPLNIAAVPDNASMSVPTLDEAQTQALAASPDIRSAQASRRAAQAALDLARRYGDPSLSLQVIDTRSGDKTAFSREDTLEASVTVPLSDGGLGHAQVREAQAGLAQAQSEVEIARQKVLTTVNAAYLTTQSTVRQIAAARSARDIAQTVYDKTVRGYQNGLFPLSDVFNAQSALTQAKIAETQAVYDAAVAVSSLNAAIKGGSPISSGSGGNP